MLEELEKIIDIEAIQSFIEEKFEGIQSFEEAVAVFMSLTMIELIQTIFKPEFDIQALWHQQEISEIKRKLERCSTIEQKKKFLQSKLDEQEIIFEEYEYFDFVEDFGIKPIGESMGEIQKMRNGLQKTSRWMEASEDDKTFMAILFEIPNELPSQAELDGLTMQKVREMIRERPILYKLFLKIQSIKKSKIPISKLILDIIKNIANFYYQNKLNVFLRQEFQKFLQVNEYQIVEVIEQNKDSLNLTKSQWVLVYYYFFKQYGLEPRKNLDVSPVARFIHLATDTTFTKIQNSEIYDKLSKAPNFKNDKELLKDLKVIRPLFEKYGFNDILQSIDNEIHSIKFEVKI